MSWSFYDANGKILHGILGGAVDTTGLADDAVTAAKLASDAVVNLSIASGAEIALNKLATTTASRILVSDGSGVITPSSVTTTNLTDLTDTGETALHTHVGAASDTAYASSWNGVTSIPPSKNAVYDKIETLTVPSDTAYASSWNGVTTIAPSKNAVYDKIETIGGAGLVLMSTIEATDDGDLNIYNLDSTYDTYMIAISDMVPITDGADLHILVGDSSGIDSSSGDYEYHSTDNSPVSGSYDSFASSSETFIPLTTNGVDNNSSNGSGVGGVLFLNRPQNGTTWPNFVGNMWWKENGGQTEGGAMMASRKSPIDLDRIQVKFATGNVSTGRLTVWGLKHG